MTVSLETGAGVEVTDISDAELYASFMGYGNYVLGKPLEAAMASPNVLSVGRGTLLQNGHHVRLRGTTDFTIPSGVQAKKRSNIVCLRTTKSRDEDTLEAVMTSEPIVHSGEPTDVGEPTDPQWLEGDLLNGDTVADFPLYRVVTDGVNALEPVPLYKVASNAAEFQAQQKEAWDSIFRAPVIGVRFAVLDNKSPNIYFDMDDGTTFRLAFNASAGKVCALEERDDEETILFAIT